MKQFFIGLAKLFFLGSDIKIFCSTRGLIQRVEWPMIIWEKKKRRDDS